jgi:hypothetical protein
LRPPLRRNRPSTGIYHMSRIVFTTAVAPVGDPKNI